MDTLIQALTIVLGSAAFVFGIMLRADRDARKGRGPK